MNKNNKWKLIGILFTGTITCRPDGSLQLSLCSCVLSHLAGAGNVRRSSRVRTKPLEFWNFEKVEVKRQEDGEVQVIHHKQDSTAHIQSRVIDCSTILGSQTARGITLSEDLLRVEESTVTSNKPRKSPKRSPKARSSVAAHPALSPKQIKRLNVTKFLSTCSPDNPRVKSPSKHRLFSPSLNYFDELVEEDSRKSKISVGGREVTIFVFVSVFSQALLLFTICIVLHYGFFSPFFSPIPHWSTASPRLSGLRF